MMKDYNGRNEVFGNILLADTAPISLKKKRFGKDITLNAGNAKNKDNIKNLIQHDDAFKVLRCLRCSPSFWEQKKKELFAMIRQLGSPTFFVTFSSAETKWCELLVILQKILHMKRQVN